MSKTYTSLYLQIARYNNWGRINYFTRIIPKCIVCLVVPFPKMKENISLGIKLHQTLYCNVFCVCSGLFFPYGPGEGDESYPANGGNPAVELQISASFPFFDRDHGSLYVRFLFLNDFNCPLI